MARAALLELASAHIGAPEVLEVVAAWLGRVATPSQRMSAPDRCECGAVLAHVAGAAVEAVMCPRCDEERLVAVACDDGDQADDTPVPPGASLAAPGVLFVFCATVSGCAQAHGRIEDGPLYVHLCEAMPEDDQVAWGEAAGEINAELGESVLWVGHGPPIGCNTVDVCPSSAVQEGVDTRGWQVCDHGAVCAGERAGRGCE